MAINGTRSAVGAGQHSWKIGLSAYKRAARKIIPSSIAQMVESEKIICDLLKDIYGHEYRSIEKLDVYREACSDIKGNLSDSGRLRVMVRLVGGGDYIYHWFVKIMPLHHQNEELVAKFDVFRNEIEFYSEIAPALKTFLNESNKLNDEVQLDIPDMLFAQEDEKRAIIVLQDLVQEGFKQERDKNGNRYLSKEMATTAVESLAKVHATSYALKMKKKIFLEKNHPSLKESGLLWTHSDMTSRLTMMKEIFCDFLKQSNQIDTPSLVEQFKNTFDSEQLLKQLCQERCSPLDESILCLQQGDFHFNNLFFKEEDGKLKVKIVDWQLAYCGRSAGDISYLLTSSLDPQVRREEEGTIKQKYFESFSKTLASLDSDSTKKDASVKIKTALGKDYEKSLPLGFFFSCGNVMQEEKSNNQEQKISFAYELCKEAAGRNLI
eukprot:GFUD01033724.1.p1 GENE.GFUD01033724.1~~GFUD01033724.1.p1  ORF type:complete len:436 (+),score=115.25 GFUD01033724.1:412-1719(+)